MISFAHLSLLALGFVCAAGEQAGEEATSPATPAPEELAHRLLTDAGYVIKHGNAFYRYPFPVERRVQQVRTNPLETNEIEGAEKEEGEEEERRPLFFFTREGPEGSTPRARPPGDRPYIEIRRKREVDDADIPESSKVGKLRRKRTYCRKCGKGGWGGYYVPVTYAVYPVYYGGGGGGKGCNVCGGGGYPGHGGGYPGYGGGGGGSFSYSSSSAHSSSGSFGWGKK